MLLPENRDPLPQHLDPVSKHLDPLAEQLDPLQQSKKPNAFLVFPIGFFGFLKNLKTPWVSSVVGVDVAAP